MVHVCSPAGDARVTEASSAQARLWAGSDSAAEAESLILVDEADREVGHMSKARCHEGRGVLHRAFSLLIFNDAGRAAAAAARGGASVCGRCTGRTAAAAIRAGPRAWRRPSSGGCTRSSGLRCPLQFLFKFQYQAQFEAAGAEHELCSVFIGRSTERGARRSRTRSRDWRWVSPERLHAEMAGRGRGALHALVQLEWERIWRDHRAGAACVTVAADSTEPAQTGADFGHSADSEVPRGALHRRAGSCAA